MAQFEVTIRATAEHAEGTDGFEITAQGGDLDAAVRVAHERAKAVRASNENVCEVV